MPALPGSRFVFSLWANIISPTLNWIECLPRLICRGFMSDQTTPQKTVRLWVICYLILLLNSSYLAGYADPTLFYFGNVALHLILGVVLTIAFAVYAFRRFS